MPIYKTKDEDFFKKWSSEMAYILGFFIADGSLTINPRGSKYIDFGITDGDLLFEIRKVLKSNHRISKINRGDNCKKVYRLQIGSKEMFNDLLKLGLKVNKTGKEVLPKVPNIYFKDFIRGYFDGDGGVWSGLCHKKDRKKPTKVLMVTFTSGGNEMLRKIACRLNKSIGTKLKRITYYGNAFRLQYSMNDSIKLYNFMYKEINNKMLFLKRKKDIFDSFINHNAGVA